MQVRNLSIGIGAGFAILLVIVVFAQIPNCSSGWLITGYYTPVELQFEGEQKEILVDEKFRFFKSDFIKTVKVEGWGKSKDGKYLGWNENKFHLSNKPADFHGDKLKLKTVAADPAILQLGSQITIPNLPDPWNTYTFDVTDVGPSITGKHIDVYTGEGKKAKNITEKITSKEQRVCIIS